MCDTRSSCCVVGIGKPVSRSFPIISPWHFPPDPLVFIDFSCLSVECFDRLFYSCKKSKKCFCPPNPSTRTLDRLFYSYKQQKSEKCQHAPSCRCQRKLALHAGALCGARGHGRVACWMLVDRHRSWQETWKEGAVQVFLVVDSRLASRRSMR